MSARSRVKVVARPHATADLVSKQIIADMFGRSPRTIETWIREGFLPAADYAPPGHGPLWERATLIEWAHERDLLIADLYAGLRVGHLAEAS